MELAIFLSSVIVFATFTLMPLARRSGAPILLIVLGIGIFCAPQFAVLSFGTVFLHDFGHVGLATITATMVFTQVGAMVMRVWSGRWTDRVSRVLTRETIMIAMTCRAAILATSATVLGTGSLAAQELQYWVYSDFAQGDALALQQEFIAEFEAENPGVKIR